jgi:hypothetical protein
MFFFKEKIQVKGLKNNQQEMQIDVENLKLIGSTRNYQQMLID